jgi:hypothetical protein
MSQVFVTKDNAPGYLEHAGKPMCVVHEQGVVRCLRWEVREAHAEFQLHNVRFRRNIDSEQWHEFDREVWDGHQSRNVAIGEVKMIERSYQEAVEDDRLDQIEALQRQQIEER